MRFEYYHEPTALGECIGLLNQYGSDARLLAGGTDLVVKLRSRVIRPKAVISLGALSELSKIKKDRGGSVEIGAMKTLREIADSDSLEGSFDVIRQGARHVSSMQVRNVATIGGNSCNASPAADTVPGLIAAEAMARIVGSKGERLLPLEDFFEGPGKTVLGVGEFITGFYIPALPPRTGGVYKKYSIRGDADLAIVGVAVRLTLDKRQMVKLARIVLGAVAPTPIRARGAEELLLGEIHNEELIEEASLAAVEECKPISDQRATAEYRKEMVKVWTRYAIREAFQKASEGKQENGAGWTHYRL